MAVTEINMWEREKWTYILDVEKQGAKILNLLNIFIRCADKQFEKDKEGAAGALFAASKYSLKFYDTHETESGYLVLVAGKDRLIMNGKPNYKSGGMFLEKKISLSRMHSAMVKMRDKGENKLYKDFESLFLK